jgi:hypothetical protein
MVGTSPTPSGDERLGPTIEWPQPSGSRCTARGRQHAARLARDSRAAEAACVPARRHGLAQGARRRGDAHDERAVRPSLAPSRWLRTPRTPRAYGPNSRTVRTAGPHVRSELPVRTHGPNCRSARTVRTAGPSCRTLRTLRALRTLRRSVRHNPRTIREARTRRISFEIRGRSRRARRQAPDLTRDFMRRGERSRARVVR